MENYAFSNPLQNVCNEVPDQTPEVKNTAVGSANENLCESVTSDSQLSDLILGITNHCSSTGCNDRIQNDKMMRSHKYLGWPFRSVWKIRVANLNLTLQSTGSQCNGFNAVRQAEGMTVRTKVLTTHHCDIVVPSHLGIENFCCGWS